MIKLYFLLPFATLLGFVANTSCAQQRLSGTIKSLNSNTAVPFALITLLDKYTKTLGFAYSDSLGRYSIQWEKKLDSAIVNISGIGFKKEQQKIYLPSDKSEHDFYLGETLKELPTINIKSTPSIVQKGDTTIFNADTYKKIQQRNIGDLLKNIPGFDVDVNGNLSYNGAVISKVLLENTDLFGNDYGKLINNISTNGIEKLEIINKYQDKSSLSSSFKSNKEQVLNIKFKGNKFVRSFGTITGGSNFKENYEGKLDMVLLSKKIKLAAFGNTNSNGILGSNSMNTNENKSATNSIFSNSIQSFEDYVYAAPLIPSSSINNIYLDKAIYNFNHTSFSNITAEYKATPRLSFKTDIGIYRDSFSQYLSSNNRYFTINPTIEIDQKDSIHNKNTHLELRSDATYNIGNNFQVKYSFNFKNTNEKQKINSLFDTLLNDQMLYSKINFSEHSLEMNYKMDSRNLLTLKGKMGKTFLPQSYSVDSFDPDTAFHYDGHFSSLIQQLESQYNTKNLQLSFTHKISENRIVTLDIGLSDNNSKLNSQLSTLQKGDLDSVSQLDSSYHNNLFFLPKCYFFSFKYSDRPSKKLHYDIGGGLSSYKLSLYNNSATYYIAAYNRWRPNIYINSDYTLNKFASINLNYEINTEKSNLNNLADGKILTSYNGIYMGNENLRLKFSQNFYFFYNYINLFRKKILFFVGAFLRSQPLLYIRNLNAGTSYIQTNLLPFAKNNESVAFFTRIEKIIPSSGSRLILNYNFNNLWTYTSSNNIVQKNKILGNKLSLQIIQDLGKYLDIDLLGEYENSINKVESISNVVVHKIHWDLTSNFKLSKKINWAIKMKQINNSSNNSIAQHIYLADTYFDYELIPNKLQLNFSLKNMFNKKQIENISTNSFYINTSSNLLRRIALTSFIFKF